MVDLHPVYPKEGADHQDAHLRSPRNFEGMKKFSADEQFHSRNEAHDQLSRNAIEGEDNEPNVTENGKNLFQMSPSELRKHIP